MTNKAIRIGFVGAGENSRKVHIPKFQAIEGVEVVSVANRSRSSGERVAAELGIPNVYEDWQTLVASPDTDAIAIGTWPYLHCAITLAALEAGKHVLTEARMAMDEAEARQMFAAAQKRPDLTCMVVPSPGTLGVDEAIEAKIREGYLGEILSIQVDGSLSNFAEFGGNLAWRHRRDLSGLNAMSMGIWYESVLRWVGAATRVMARSRTVVDRRIDPASGKETETTVPDHIEIIADMANGAIGRFTFSNVTGLAPAPQCWLYGTEGTLRYDHGSRTLFGGRRGDTALEPIEIPAAQQRSWRVEEEFIGAMRGLEPVRRTSFADGVRYMEFTQAVSHSAATGKAVELVGTL